MLASYSYCLAPWVIEKNNLLLGHKLNAIRVPYLHFSKIPVNKLKYLIDSNFIVDEQNKVYNERAFSSQSSEESTDHFDIPLNWIWVSNNSLLTSAFLLKKYLSSFNLPDRWEVATDKNAILNNLSVYSSKKPFLIRLSHQEPVGDKVIKKIYADLIDKTKIIWVGESTDGIHIGPVIQTEHDLEKYHIAKKPDIFPKN